MMCFPRRTPVFLSFVLGLATLLLACADKSSNGPSSNPDDAQTTPTPTAASEKWAALLAARKTDTSTALRTTVLRLSGRLPSLGEVQVLAASDGEEQKKATYAAILDEYLQGDKHRADLQQMLIWYWRNVMKMGEDNDANANSSGLDSAPLFAAHLALSGRSMLELFTASEGTCPSLQNGVIVLANCNNAVATHAGVLSNPDAMRHFASNMAFRRVKWVQETFMCSSMPAEYVAEPKPVGNSGLLYTTPWPIESIAGRSNGGSVDFHDLDSMVCANCHGTLNHQAPLFGLFNGAGVFVADFAVPLPGGGNARFSDWLSDGQTTAWRFGKPAADLPALGRALAADPGAARCMVARVWAWAMGKPDVVTSKLVIPDEVLAPLLEQFVASNYNFRVLLRAAFMSEDFTKF